MEVKLRLDTMKSYAFALLISICGIPTIQAFSQNSIIGDKPDQVLAPFLWSWIDADYFSEETFEQIKAKKDPLSVFRLAFHQLVRFERNNDKEALAGAIRTLDYALDQYEPADRTTDAYRWFYGFDYEGDVKAPWWSGMDGFFGPMTLFAAWQVTGDERYRDVAIKSAERMLEDPTKGGVLWRTEKGCWISEYSWNGMQADQEYYVLNGHLWGLQALYMLQEVADSPALTSAFKCSLKGTVEHLPQFYNANGSWTVYKQKGRTINPTHYNLLETAQFRSLWHLTGEPAFKEAADRRAEIFKRTYPLHLVETERGKEIQFSMIGAPHPYWTDTYPVRVSCMVEGKPAEASNGAVYDKTKPLSERLLLRLPVSDNPQSCDVFIKSNVSIKVYTQSAFEPINDDIDEQIRLDITPLLLAQHGDELGTFVVSVEGNDRAKATDEARLVFALDRQLEPSDTIGLIIRPSQTVRSGALLTDVNGVTAHRSYQPLQANQDNMVLLNVVGFDNGDRLAAAIKSLSLRIYRTKENKDVEIEVKEASMLRNPPEIRHFMERNAQARFPQQ